MKTDRNRDPDSTAALNHPGGGGATAWLFVRCPEQTLDTFMNATLQKVTDGKLSRSELLLFQKILRKAKPHKVPVEAD